MSVVKGEIGAPSQSSAFAAMIGGPMGLTNVLDKGDVFGSQGIKQSLVRCIIP